MSKTFLISDTDIRDLFSYNQELGELIWKIQPCKWIFVGDKAGSKRKDGYIEVGLQRKRYLLHRLIFFYHYGYFPKLIDHIDRDQTNNRIENLREATRKVNAYNCGTPKNNTSGYRGVSWCKAQSKWTARYKHLGKYLFLGYFDSIEEAHNKRTSFERGHHE